LKAVSIGELAVDWLSLEKGESMMSASRFYRYMGGNATNVAVGLARLGLDSAIISKVGVDVHADYLLASLEKEGVYTGWVAENPELATAQCYMTRRQDGFPDYYAWPSPNASKGLLPEDIKDEYFADSWIWHAAAVTFIARPRRFAMLHAMEKARLNNKIISFDAGFPFSVGGEGRQAAWQAMQMADILKFNLAEASYWSDTEIGLGVEAMVARLQSCLSPALLVVTLAEKGAVLFAGGKSAFCPPYPVESCGDVGCGDAFSAGLIYGLHTLSDPAKEPGCLYELDMETWGRLAAYGACAGALVTRACSATESFPDVRELEAAMVKSPWRS
jgi:fructokinase